MYVFMVLIITIVLVSIVKNCISINKTQKELCEYFLKNYFKG